MPIDNDEKKVIGRKFTEEFGWIHFGINIPGSDLVQNFFNRFSVNRK